MEILKINNLTKLFVEGDKKTGIQNISFSLKKGEILCLVGPNGSGKTTLLRSIAGLEKTDSGSITLVNENSIILNSKQIKEELKNNISFVPQDYNLWNHKTILENLTLSLILGKKIKILEANNIAEKLLKKFELLDKMNNYPDSLSGGQKQRIAILRAVALNPKVLLLDEITSSLDPILINSVLNLVKVLAKEGQSMVIATHNIKFASEVADKIIYLENGSIVQESSPQQFIYEQNNEIIKKFVSNISLNSKEINIYEGYDQFQAFQLGTLKRFKNGSSKYVVGSFGDKWIESMGGYYKLYETQRIEKNISWKMLMYEESALDRDIRKRHLKINEYRLIPKQYENPANYYVIEDCVVIQIFGKPGDKPIIIEIKNPYVAKSYKNYFDLLWEKGTPINN